MKMHDLQLVTVGLADGQQGVFVGWPLLPKDASASGGQVENIWFSDVQAVPDNLTLEQLMELVRKQLSDALAPVQ